ncbi:hypothetical protein [Holospora elegans]|nr:hypothetical protein [Holospora elegans]
MITVFKSVFVGSIAQNAYGSLSNLEQSKLVDNHDAEILSDYSCQSSQSGSNPDAEILSDFHQSSESGTDFLSHTNQFSALGSPQYSETSTDIGQLDQLEEISGFNLPNFSDINIISQINLLDFESNAGFRSFFESNADFRSLILEAHREDVEYFSGYNRILRNITLEGAFYSNQSGEFSEFDW